MTDFIKIEHPDEHPGVVIIRLNRPDKKNAISTDMYRAMTQALEHANEDDATHVVVFLGSETCFSAGNDIADFVGFAQSGTMDDAAITFLKALVQAQKPLLSGVAGIAVGIGLTIHLHCDLTIAAYETVFQAPFVDLGLVPEAASSLLVPRLMGHQRAFALLVAGEPFDADAALQAGLVYRLEHAESVEAETLKLASQLAAKPPQALRAARALLRGDTAPVLARMDAEIASFTERLQSDEAKTAFQTFLKKV